ncbi:hypothetical protein ACFSKU_04075 [Pontibacter silvestris]|uniref:Uncharacterized protein n=1 Tax=Pontibacter silvestris TaxID=2305183 RepID=A0ABW4WTH4_9BACT|nr:hypothetical protein [Pontibacter silvestris]MCC9138972.1 hypothetical protein [Pontibacter silvestris]
MKSKYEVNFEELQQVDNASNDLEFDRLYRSYLNECHEQGFGLISYTEYHLLHKADTITEAWIADEIIAQEQLNTTRLTQFAKRL